MPRAPKVVTSCNRIWLVLLIFGIVVVLGTSLWWIYFSSVHEAAANDAPPAAAPAERAETPRPCPPARSCPSPRQPHACPSPVQCPVPEPASVCSEPEPVPACPAPIVCDPCPKPTAVPGVTSAEISNADAMQGLQRFSALLRKHTNWEQRQNGGHQHEVIPDSCKIVRLGVGFGMHEACDIPHEMHNKCVFYSVGIQNDYSFDKDLVDRYGCKGFALDPSIVHPSILTPNVIFMSIGASLLTRHQHGADDWQVTSMPSLRRFLQHDYVDVLKMDCEGCEYSLARDILLEDPAFFSHVGQVILEIHVFLDIAKTHEHAANLGRLFILLERSGLVLIDARIAGCSREDEAKGCGPDILESGYICEANAMCHNLLFGRLNGS